MARSVLLFSLALLAVGCGFSESPDDRAAAQWVIAQGGTVDLVDQDLPIRDLAKLPAEPFRVDGIDLNERKINEAELAKFIPLKHLRELRLYNTGLTDAGLDHIAQMASLEELEISYNNISDDGIAKLSPLTNLKTLYVRGTGVTPDGVQSLQAGRPGLTVHYR